jgi:hypothetical protein
MNSCPTRCASDIALKTRCALVSAGAADVRELGTDLGGGDEDVTAVLDGVGSGATVGGSGLPAVEAPGPSEVQAHRANKAHPTAAYVRSRIKT